MAEKSLLIDSVDCKKVSAKCLKMRGGSTALDVVASNSGIGIWLQNDNGPIGLVSHDDLAYFMIYAKGNNKLPFALSQVDIQIPNSKGKVERLSYDELFDLVRIMRKIDIDALLNAFSK